MRISLRTFWFTSICLLVGAASNAQDFKSLFKEMRQRYDTMSGFHIVMVVKAADNEKDAPYFTQTYDLKKQGTSYLYSSENNIMLMNDTHIVVVDKEIRQIILNIRNKELEAEMARSLNFDLDSMLSVHGMPKYTGELDGQLMFSQELTKGPVKRITMKIDKDRRLISRVEYHYRESQYVSVDFTLFDTDPVFESETFSNSRLVVTDKGKYRPAMTYKGFEVTESNLN